MSRIKLFLGAMMVSLAALTWVAAMLVQRTTRAWFEKDIRLRSALAVKGARHALLARWGAAPDEPGLVAILTDMTFDERLMAAAACDREFSLLARTPHFPAGLGCGEFRTVVDGSTAWSPAARTASLPGGQVRLDAVPLLDAGEPAGFVLLVHDLSFVHRREQQTRLFLIAAFAVLALAGGAVTVLAMRASGRGFRTELARLLRGEPASEEFRPLFSDLREHLAKLASAGDADEASTEGWGRDRLRRLIEQHFPGRRVIVLANREPYVHQRLSSGEVTVLHPASGLVTAVEPVLRACSGVWVGHGSGSGDRQTADRHGRLRVPPGRDEYLLRRVWLTPEEERGYYYGFSNEGLWPLCHVAHTRPEFRHEDWEQYQAVNRKFADAVCEEAGSDDPLVLVQDYHFALAPRYIRERLPRATIVTFWHIPWPNSERFGICPWREELLQGLLGSSIIGFHIQLHCNNFLEAVDRYLESRIDREQSGVVQGGRSTLVRSYPISIEWPSAWLSGAEPVDQCRTSIRAELGLEPNALVGVGVDRLDYTKGVEERLAAVERLLERAPAMRGRFSFVQLAAPSRTVIERYRDLNARVEALATRINERFGTSRYKPVVLLRAHHEPPTVFRYYRAADLCYVSSLHDGMNLVAKEFVAARDDEDGVLVLSQFTGAARELTEALIVNPYDIDSASAAMLRALQMDRRERRERMRAMRAYLAEFNVHRWAGRMLVHAARLHRRERMSETWIDRQLERAAARS